MPNSPPRVSIAIALFAAFSPALLAGLLTHHAPQGRSLVGEIERDQLIFSQYALNLGTVRPTGTVPAYFDFFNAGETPLKILSLKASCGCLAPRLIDEKTVYAPGEHGRFYISVKTANESPGEKDYTVDVQYDNGEVKNRSVSFQLTIPEKKVSVVPSEVYFYQLTGKADSREIVVEDHRGKALNILDVSCSSDHAAITLGEKIIEGNSAKTPIRIDVPGDVPSGRSTAVLTMRTDDPEYAVIKVPILIWGPEKGVQPVNAEEVQAVDPQSE